MRPIPIILLLLLTFSMSAQIVNNLKVEQPLLKDLFVWGDYIIAEKDHNKPDKFYFCDIISKQLIPLTIEGNSEIIYLAESKSFLFAIVKNENTFNLISKNKKGQLWEKENLFTEFSQIKDAKFVALDSLLMLVTPEKIYYKRYNSVWQSVLLRSLIDRRYLMTPYESAPHHCLLTPYSLYLGYDYGEWSGALIEIPFVTNKKLVFKKGKLVVRDNVRAISRATSGLIWCATGLAHMGLAESEIYKYKNNNLQKVLWSQPSLSLPKKSDLSAFCLKNNEEPFFIASDLGVFKIINDTLHQVIKANLYISYPVKNYSIGSNPEAMYVDSSGNLFIASRSLGVFFYAKKSNGYEFAQLIF